MEQNNGRCDGSGFNVNNSENGGGVAQQNDKIWETNRKREFEVNMEGGEQRQGLCGQRKVTSALALSFI